MAMGFLKEVSKSELNSNSASKSISNLKSIKSAGSSSRSQEQESGYPRWHSAVAGAAAGAGARLLTAPLDLLKIRRQLLSSQSSAPQGFASSLRHIVQTEGGFRSLFRGNVAATYLWIGYAAVQFSLYSRTSEFLSGFASSSSSSFPVAPPPIVAHALSSIAASPAALAFCSGATAGTVATLATYPFDICRTAFAARGLATAAPSSVMPPPPKTLFDFARSTYQRRGLSGFFAGSAPAVVQIVPYMGLNFALYDALTRRHQELERRRQMNGQGGGERRLTFGGAGVAGALSGGLSKFLVYPMDTVKKRLQATTFLISEAHAGGKAGAASLATRDYKNMLDCVTRMAKEEGVGAFYRGLVPTVIKSMAGTGLTFAFFTLTKNGLEAFHDGVLTASLDRRRRDDCLGDDMKDDSPKR